MPSGLSPDIVNSTNAFGT
ncbi:hypothetical protein F383_39487 [Gossypium arboreum]|uniref:Uncharacterized protein n=1 Tax=Gossypium arboreum TaxID=29729 RepID=A0A0B0MU62_GOSAR|nr:hypothetical protein F383_39487 [Gossypium arboreum]